jgi:hypothetical protein
MEGPDYQTSNYQTPRLPNVQLLLYQNVSEMSSLHSYLCMYEICMWSLSISSPRIPGQRWPCKRTVWLSVSTTRQATAGLWTRPYQQQDLNLSLYSSLFSPDTILTALCCTFSRQALSPSVHGDQACVENSKWGLTYCLNSLMKTCLGSLCRFGALSCWFQIGGYHHSNVSLLFCCLQDLATTYLLLIPWVCITLH